MAVIIFLLFLTFLLGSAEVIVPGGIFALMAFLALAGAGIATYLDFGIWIAMAVFFCGFIINLCMVYALFRILGKTHLRKRFILGNSVLGQTAGEPDDETLMGREGIALTTMSPSGRIQVEGQDHEGLSRSGLITKGTPIRVVGRDSFRLVVEKISS